MKKIILCLMLSLALPVMPSYAAESMEVTYSYTENKITLNASTDIANSDVAVYVLPESADPDNMGTTVMPVAADYISADGEGKIVNYNMYFSADRAYFPYGTYQVYLYYRSDGAQHKAFTYLSPQDRILKAVRECEDGDRLRIAVLSKDEDGNTVNDHVGYISPDLYYYNQLSSKNRVFVDMHPRIGEISSFDDIADLFYSISKDCYDDENESSGGGYSGGGGGGGMSAGSYPAQKPQVNPSVPVTPPVNQIPEFADMAGHWASDTVYAMAQKGIVNGFETGEFKPENPVTRAEFTKMAVCTFGLLKDAPNVFGDVAEGMWYEEYISAAADRGIVSGNGGNFYPENKITREDAAVILYNTITKLGSFGDSTADFEDMHQVADYARTAVSVLAGNHIVSGTTQSTFSPKKDTTRAEAATLIYRAYEYYMAH